MSTRTRRKEPYEVRVAKRLVLSLKKHYNQPDEAYFSFEETVAAVVKVLRRARRHFMRHARRPKEAP